MKHALLTTVVLSGLLSASAMAQTAEPARPPGGGDNAGNNDRGRRGNFDPAQWRQQQEQRMKEQLGVSDEEFKALQPKIEKIQTLQRDQLMSRFSGMGRGRGGDRPAAGGDRPAAGGERPTTGGERPAAGGDRSGGFGQASNSPLAQKTRDLQQAIDNKDAKPDEIKAKLDALRAERAKAREELTKAQADLREYLTPRQEAVLVTQGVLD